MESSSFSTGARTRTFELNNPRYKGAQILVPARTSAAARRVNMPPGRSQDYGFRCVIAPSFADIFHSNAGKNGILLVTLPEEQVQTLLDRSRKAHDGYQFTVSLEDNTVARQQG